MKEMAETLNTNEDDVITRIFGTKFTTQSIEASTDEDMMKVISFF